MRRRLRGRPVGARSLSPRARPADQVVEMTHARKTEGCDALRDWTVARGARTGLAGWLARLVGDRRRGGGRPGPGDALYRRDRAGARCLAPRAQTDLRARRT